MKGNLALSLKAPIIWFLKGLIDLAGSSLWYFILFHIYFSFQVGWTTWVWFGGH